MALRGPVLVGTDLSETSDEALRQAAHLARDLDGRLIVCHVIPELLPDGSLFAEFRRSHLAVEESILAKARAAVQDQLDRVVDNETLAVETVLEFGTEHAGLLAQAEEQRAGVLVTVPGRVAAEVVRHASSAVLVARRSAHGPVVGATDFSDPSYPALRVAAEESRRRGTEFHLVHAFDAALFALGAGHAPPAALPYLAGSSPIALEGLDELRNQATVRLQEASRELGVANEAKVLTGPAADTIARYADSVHAELLVVGTHGRTGLKRVTLGSTAAAIIETAPCSVLVVRLTVP
jgi:nucleotide-binding universal stress UspA family protein